MRINCVRELIYSLNEEMEKGKFSRFWKSKSIPARSQDDGSSGEGIAVRQAPLQPSGTNSSVHIRTKIWTMAENGWGIVLALPFGSFLFRWNSKPFIFSLYSQKA